MGDNIRLTSDQLSFKQVHGQNYQAIGEKRRGGRAGGEKE